MNLINKIKNKFLKPCIDPHQVTIDISGNCNAQCPFCYRQVFDYPQSGFMPKEMFYEIIKQVKDIPSIKTVSLAVLGEPLLHPDFDEFIDYLSRLKYDIFFPTNMSLADRHFESLLKTKQLIFSIEGHNKENYERYRKNLNFDQVFDNIKRFDELIKEKRKKGETTPTRCINYIVSKNSDVNKFIELWGEYADLIRVYPIRDPYKWDDQNGCLVSQTIDSMQDEIIPKTKLLKKIECSDLYHSIVISTTGKLNLCFSGVECKLDFGDYKDIKNNYFYNKNFNKIRNEIKKNKPQVCKNCFQNFDISKETLSEYLPALNELKNPKVKVFK